MAFGLNYFIKKILAPVAFIAIQQGSLLTDNAEEEKGQNVIMPNETDSYNSLPEGKESLLTDIEDSSINNVDEETKLQAENILEEVQEHAQKTNNDPLELLKLPLIGLLDEYKKTIQKNQELESRNAELEEKLNKFNGALNTKRAADKFAIKMFPHVIEAQKNEIKSEAKIAAYFNDKGFPSSTGKKFVPSSVHILLKRQKSLGLFDKEEKNNNSPDIA